MNIELSFKNDEEHIKLYKKIRKIVESGLKDSIMNKKLQFTEEELTQRINGTTIAAFFISAFAMAEEIDSMGVFSAFSVIFDSLAYYMKDQDSSNKMKLTEVICHLATDKLLSDVERLQMEKEMLGRIMRRADNDDGGEQSVH